MIDTIPQEVLMDYQNRTVSRARKPRWDNVSQTSLTLEVLFVELEPLGFVEFTTSPTADTRHGELLWSRALDGEFGMIADYVPPTQEELRETFPTLTRRQFVAGLIELDIFEEDIDALVADDPRNRNEWRNASQFERLHPLVVLLSAQFELTPEELDELWLTVADY